MKCVSVVGIGPGNELYLSIAAKETLEESDVCRTCRRVFAWKRVFVHWYDKRGGPL